MDRNTIKTTWALIVSHTPAIVARLRAGCDKAKPAEFLAPLCLRLYLAPVFWMAGVQKFSHFSQTVEWFGNSETGLGLPAPYLLVLLVALCETLGALFLLLGFATRLITLPLMIIMLVAAYSVHLENGWLAIASGDGIFASPRTQAAIERLQQAQEILQNQGDYTWLTEHGSFVVLNNGIEFAVTYFIMLLALFFSGGGRFLSADYWLVQHYFRQPD
ncbi:DoxX family protein [Methylomonas paludis]|uniref:DoxX family protein n=1 Tax=Methylomonas paludis TaxID=1173101 RepID=A0A975MPH8_9GAMM|nr:DoxX family protein [Methylomonas paludis]QWF71641.1 DoxX family protein [Methylomonas paludis]